MLQVSLKPFPQKGHRQVHVDGPVFRIGRAPDCDFCVTNPLVSRHHCEIVVDDDGVIVRDTGSRNGTYVNRDAVSAERRLKDGDWLFVAQVPFEVKIEDSDSSSMFDFLSRSFHLSAAR